MKGCILTAPFMLSLIPHQKLLPVFKYTDIDTWTLHKFSAFYSHEMFFSQQSNANTSIQKYISLKKFAFLYQFLKSMFTYSNIDKKEPWQKKT